MTPGPPLPLVSPSVTNLRLAILNADNLFAEVEAFFDDRPEEYEAAETHRAGRAQLARILENLK